MMLVSLALPTWLLVEAGGMEAGGTSSPARISGDDLCAMARSIDASNPPSFCTQASLANILKFDVPVADVLPVDRTGVAAQGIAYQGNPVHSVREGFVFVSSDSRPVS